MGEVGLPQGRGNWCPQPRMPLPTIYRGVGDWGCSPSPSSKEGRRPRGRSALQVKWRALPLRVSLPLGAWASLGLVPLTQ